MTGARPAAPSSPGVRLWYAYYRRLGQVLQPWLRRRQRRVALRRCPEMAEVLEALDAAHAPLEPGERAHLEIADRQLAPDPELTYGELHWSSFVRLLAAAEVRPDDRFVELGCGTGQFCFYLRLRHGVPATGVDRLRTFVGAAQRVAADLGHSALTFREEDLTTTDLSRGSLFYVASTCLGDDAMRALGDHFRAAPVGARMISVGRPLPGHPVVARRRCRFPSGPDEAWIHARR